MMAINLTKHQLLINNFLEYKGTMKKYCAENNVKYRTFRRWLSKLKLTSRNIKKEEKLKCSEQEDTLTSQKPKFIKFKLPESNIIKVHLPNGLIVEVLSKNLSILVKELSHVVF